MKNENKIVIYQGKDGKVELRADIERDTIWATQGQIAKLFNVNPQAITKHISNIYDEGELSKSSTCSKMEQVQNEGGRSVKRQIELYNLDVIIAVGYRVNSKKATKFRIWATGILRDYLVKGFSLNKRQLTLSKEKELDLQEAIEFIKSAPSDKPLKARLSLRIHKDVIK